MIEWVPGVRNAVRALILRDDAVLVQYKVYEDGSERYVLPGGAPKLGETLVEGLQRECFEEIACQVDIGALLYIADFFKLRDTDPPTRRHQLEFIFHCHVSATYTPQNGAFPDKHQKDVIWLKTAEIKNVPFFPSGLTTIISQASPKALTKIPVYLGLID